MLELYDSNAFEDELDEKIEKIVDEIVPKKSVYEAEVVRQDVQGTWWVRLPGADSDTPVMSSTVDMKVGDRVTVELEDHVTRVTGNITNPPMSASTSVEYVAQEMQPISGYVKELKAGDITAETIKATEAYIGSLIAEDISADTISATQGYITTLVSGNVTAEELCATHATVSELDALGITAQTLSADHAAIETLEANKIDVDDFTASTAAITGRLDAAESSINSLQTNSLTANSAVILSLQAKDAAIEEVLADKATIASLNAATARIGAIEADYLVAADMTAEVGRVNTLLANYTTTESLAANYATIARLETAEADIDDLSANKATIADLNAATARIGAIEADYLVAADMTAETARVDNLLAGKATVADLNAATGRITTLESSKADISLLESDYITAAAIDASYAQVDFSNVTASWIQNGVIKNGAISNAMINSVSANKLTAGTIDASVIDVTNLNAKNIKVDKINGITVAGKSIEDALEQHESDISDLDDKIDSEVDALNDRIDGAIETFTGTAVPTLLNAPAEDWTDYDVHVGDVYYVVNPNIPQNGYCYRFAFIDDEYSWQLIKDSDVTAALARLQTAEGNIATIQTFDQEIATFKTDTESELSTLMTKTTTLETNVQTALTQVATKVETSVFNETKQTVDENSNAITTLSSVVQSTGAGVLDLFSMDIWESGSTAANAIGKTYDQLKANAGIHARMISTSSIQPGKYTVTQAYHSYWYSFDDAGGMLTYTGWKTESEFTFEVPNGAASYAVVIRRPDNATITDVAAEAAASKLRLKYAYASQSDLTSLTTTVNDVSQTATSNSASITQLNTTVQNNYETVSNKFNTVDQTLEGITTSIGSIEDTLEEKADGSTLSELSAKVNTVSDTVEGHTQTISSVQSTQTTMGNTLKTATKSTVQLWYSKADTTAPAKPTSHVSSTATTGGAWTTAVPAYNASYPNYFYCYEWQYTDDSYGWSGVTLDIAMGETQERARTAIGNASAAQNTANSAIKSSVQLWFTKANSTAPAKPTARVSTSNAATGNAWNLVVPTYNASYPHYFYCYQYELADGTYDWSDVVYDAATTENQATSRSAASGVSTLTTRTNEISDTVDGHTSQITHVTKTANASGFGTIDYSAMGVWEQGSTANEVIGKTYDQMKANYTAAIRFKAPMPITQGVYSVTIANGYRYYTHFFDIDGHLCQTQTWTSTAEGSLTVPQDARSVVFLLKRPDGNAIEDVDAAADASKLRLTYAYLTEEDVSEFRSDYATFKQTVNEFNSTIGTTYATKTELSGAVSGVELTKTASGDRSIFTENAAPLPLIDLEPVYGESVQDDTPTPDAPKQIYCVKSPNILNGENANASFIETTDSFEFSGWTAILWSKTFLSTVLEAGQTYFLTFTATCTMIPDSSYTYKENRQSPILINQGIGTYIKGISTDVLASNIGTPYEFIIRYTYNGTWNGTQEYFGLSGYTALFKNSGGACAYATFKIEDIQLARADNATTYIPKKYSPFGRIGVVSQGKNFLSPTNGSGSGLSWTVDSNGRISVSGTATSAGWKSVWVGTLPLGTYTYSSNGTLAFKLLKGYTDVGYAGTITVTGEADVYRLSLNTAANTAYSGYAYAQLERGTEATEYEPYREHVTYLDLKGNELHGLDDTYRDILRIDESGHAVIEKRTGKTTVGDMTGMRKYTTKVYWGKVSDMLGQDILQGTTHINTHPLYSDRFVHTEGTDIVWTNGTVGYFTRHAVAAYPNYNHGVFFKTETDYSGGPQFQEAFSDTEIIYPLDSPYTIDLGYVDLPETIDGGTVYVDAEVQPVIGGSWWTKAGYSVGKLAEEAKADPNYNTDTTYSKFSDTVVAGKNGLRPYTLCMKDDEGNWTSVVNQGSDAFSGKTCYTGGLQLGGILWHATNATYGAGTSGGQVWESYGGIDFRYSANGISTDRTVTTLQLRKPLYLVGTLDEDDGLFYLDTVKWWTQDTFQEGRVYVQIGTAYDSYYAIFLAANNPSYVWDPTAQKLVEFAYSRIKKAETAIVQTNDLIGFTATSNYSSLKEYADGIMAQEVSDRNSAISDAADEISLTVSQTYASKASLDTRVHDEDTFLRRQLPSTVHTGAARIASIKGNTVRWNQLVNYTISTQTKNGVTFTKNGDGTLTANGTATADAYPSMAVSTVANHKYLLKCCPSGGSNATYLSYVTGAGIPFSDATRDTGNGAVYTPSTSAGGTFVPAMVRSGVTVSNLVFTPQIFDLTLMFGAGNEPATVAEFEALFPEPYYPYDPGSLLSVNVEGMKAVGFNQYPQDMHHLTTSEAKNLVFDATECAHLLGGYTYRLTFGVSGATSWRVGFIVFDKNGNRYISSTTIRPDDSGLFSMFSPSINYNTNIDGFLIGSNGTVDSYTFTPAVDMYMYLYIAFGNTTANTVSTNTCVHIADNESLNGTYEPYRESLCEIDAASCFPTGLKSAGTAYDELDFEKRKSITRVGAVDLGTLDWTKVSPRYYHQISVNNPDIQLPALVSANQIANVSCSKYSLVSTRSAIEQVDDAVSIHGDSGARYITIVDSDYTDAATFKAAMSGVMLYYELATPTETDISDALQSTYTVEAGGTEFVLVDEEQAAPQSAPVPFVFEYGLSAMDALADAVVRMSSAESAIVQNADNISMKVSRTDYNGQTVASLINQSPDTIKIAAQHVEIDGNTVFRNSSTSATTFANYVSGSAQTAVDNLQIGGRNLLYNSSTITGSDYGSLGSSPLDGGTAGSLKHVESTNVWKGIGIALHKVLQRAGAMIGDTVTLSIWVSNTSVEPVNRNIYLYRAATSSSTPGINNPGGTNYYVGLSLKSGEWKRVYATFDVTDYALNTVKVTRFETNATESTNKMLWTAPQLEFGNKATQWQPAPEDLQAGIDAASAVVTVYPTAIDYVAGTATLAVKLHVNGEAKTPTSYKWTKNTSDESIGTNATLDVSDLDAVYNCLCTWS